MAPACQIKLEDKKGYIRNLGRILVRRHGKKKYYKPEEVKKAHRESVWASLDFSCWEMSVFTSHSEFDANHQETGDTCDYVDMKTEMLQGLSVAGGESWLDIPGLDIDTSWLDFGEVVTEVLGGIGEFLAGVGDAL